MAEDVNSDVQSKSVSSLELVIESDEAIRPFMFDVHNTRRSQKKTLSNTSADQPERRESNADRTIPSPGAPALIAKSCPRKQKVFVASRRWTFWDTV